MRKPTDEEKKLRTMLKNVISWTRREMRRPTDEEMRFREILSYIVYDGYGWRGESMFAVVEKLLEETAWMVEPADPTERLWELAEEIVDDDPVIQPPYPVHISCRQWQELKQLVKERKRATTKTTGQSPET